MFLGVQENNSKNKVSKEATRGIHLCSLRITNWSWGGEEILETCYFVGCFFITGFFGGKKNPKCSSGWWFQPIPKIWSSNWIISPGRGENKTYLKPPTSHWWGQTLFSVVLGGRKNLKRYFHGKEPIDMIYRIACLWTTLLKIHSEALFLMKCKLKSKLFRGLKKLKSRLNQRSFKVLRK